VASVARRPDGLLEIALRGADESAASVISALVRGGIRVATFSQAASDLEELFLQITDVTPTEVAA
jgi:ABC-2 type transport system ATP-binding protein